MMLKRFIYYGTRRPIRSKYSSLLLKMNTTANPHVIYAKCCRNYTYSPASLNIPTQAMRFARQEIFVVKIPSRRQPKDSPRAAKCRRVVIHRGMFIKHFFPHARITITKTILLHCYRRYPYPTLSTCESLLVRRSTSCPSCSCDLEYSKCPSSADP